MILSCPFRIDSIRHKFDFNVIYQLCVFRADRKIKMAARPMIGWYIFYFSFETAERNSTKLDRKQDPNVLYQVYVFGPIGKTRCQSRPLIGWDIFDSWTCLVSGLLNFGHPSVLLFCFRLLLCHRWTEFNETWQEARSQGLLSSWRFSDWLENKMVALASDWLRYFRLPIWNH